MSRSAGEPRRTDDPRRLGASVASASADSGETTEFAPVVPGVVQGTTAPTIEQPPPVFSSRAPGELAAVVAGVEVANRPVEIFGDSAPDLSREIRSLRQDRLRAATGFLFVALVIGMVWPFFLGYYEGWEIQTAELLLLAGVVGALSRVRPMPPRWLRVMEVVTFGSVAAIMAWSQYESVLYEAHAQDPAGLTAAVENAIANYALLILIYAMLIPNRWQIVVPVVVVLVATPLATQFYLSNRHPEVIAFAHAVATTDRVISNMMTLVMASALAIFGTIVLNRLRREVFEARQLNQYRLGRRIGAGGMGEVFLAEHHLLKRPCAIKLIRPDRAGDPKALARFEREVQATAQLTHPNTVEIYDYGHTSDGTFFYVMEYLRGLALDELVAEYGPLPPGRVVYLLRQACGALAEAHQSGMIHRDLKPGNLFAASRGGMCDIVKLLDFGLVKPQGGDEHDSELSREGFVRGTPQYMAPEQITSGQTIDHRCDLYAMGGVAYFLLTGRAPFDGPSAVNVMIAQVRDVPMPPSQLRPEVPGDLEAVVLRCLSKDRNDRYPDAIALQHAMDACACARDWSAAQAASWWAEHNARARDTSSQPSN